MKAIYTLAFLTIGPLSVAVLKEISTQHSLAKHSKSGYSDVDVYRSAHGTRVHALATYTYTFP